MVVVRSGCYSCILKVELIGFDDGLLVGCGRQGVKNGPGFWMDQIETMEFSFTERNKGKLRLGWYSIIE